MSSISHADAARVVSILDEQIGIYRSSHMSPGAQQFADEKRAEMIETLQSEIPHELWFQGEVFPSATLHFDSANGFTVSTTTTGHDAELHVAAINAALEALDVAYLQTHDGLTADGMTADE